MGTVTKEKKMTKKKITQMILKKTFFKLMNNAVFWKNYEKCEKT